MRILQKKMFRSFDEEMGSTEFANFILLGNPEGDRIELPRARKALNEKWTLEDAGISFKNSTFDLLERADSAGIPFRRPTDAVLKIDPKAQGVLTYLVNAIERKQAGDVNGSNLIPYSMVSAVRPDSVAFLPDDFKNDEVALNEWAVRDLNLTVGDEVTLQYFSVGERRKLLEQNATFRLRTIVPMPEPLEEGEESDWTPRFPGLSDAESCGEWDTGIPITHEIRPRDEQYWDEYRGSPKAFVSLAAGQRMWNNRWGSLTGIRIPREGNATKQLGADLQSLLSAQEAG